MSIRQDQAQLIITIDAKESVEYQKAVQRSNELVRNIKKMEVGTDEYIAALREQAEISKRLGDVDYTKLSLKNLTDRKKALIDQIRILPQAQAAELGLERELQRVNHELSENAKRTRAVGQVSSSISSSIKGMVSAYIGLSVLKNVGLQLFDQIKKIDSLDKAYEKIIPNTKNLARANEFLTRISNNYGLEINSLRDEYIKYTASAKASTLALSDQELVFESVAKASSTLGLSTETQNRAFTALQQIMSKGKVSAEELKGQLGDALPGAVTIMAKALGVGVGELQKMLEAGEVMADEALPKFAIELQKAYGVENVTKIENIAAAQGRFKNAITEFVAALGEKYGATIQSIITRTASLVTNIKEFIIPTKTATEVTKNLQAEFNNEIGVLKRLSPEANGRKELIQQINEKYKEYLPNLISENASIRDIEKAQRDANKVFEEKLIYIAFEEEYKKQVDKTKEAVKQLAYTELARARAAQNNENLGKIGASPAQLEVQKKANEGFIDLVQKNAQEQIDNNDKVVKDLEDAFDKTAKRIGSSLDKIRTKFAQTKDTGGGGTTKVNNNTETDSKSNKKENQYSEVPKTFTISSIPYIDERFKLLEDAAKREQTILEESYQQGKITQDEYELEKLRNQSAHLATKLEMLSAAGLKESDKYREINVELLKTDKELLNKRAQQIRDNEVVELSELENSFVERLISEEEYQSKSLKIRINFAQLKLDQMIAEGLQETEVFKSTQEELLNLKKEYNAKNKENDLKNQIDSSTSYNEALQDYYKAVKEYQDGHINELTLLAAKEKAIQLGVVENFRDSLQLGIELLSQDEKARKKHANAIKAFATAQVVVSLATEVQSIWRNANANIANAVVPGWAQAFAVIQTGLAVGRAGLQLRKINSQQFYKGGAIRTVSGRLITEAPNIPTQTGGDNVLIAAKPGEVVLNHEQQHALGGAATFKRIGVPGFNSGGIVPSLPSTTPTNLNARVLSSNQIQQPIIQTDPRIEMLANAVERLATVMPDALSNIKADVSYFDIKNKENTVNEIKSLSSY